MAKVNPKEKGDMLLKILNVITDINSDIIFIYNEEFGYYEKENSKKYLEQYIQKFLDFETSDFAVKQIINYIKRKTYTNITFDNNYICFDNCLFDLEALRIIEHSPEKFVPFRIPIVYDENVSIEPIKKFIDKLVIETDAITLQESIGNILAPHYETKKLLYSLGKNDSGKSTLYNILQDVISEDNCCSLTFNQLGEKFTNADIYLKRANFCSDVPYTIDRRNNGLIKNFTGGDRVTLQFKHKDPFKWKSYCKQFFSGNKIPSVTIDGDSGFLRRWQFISFPNKFPPDDSIFSKYTTPTMKSAWINWMIEGYQRLKNNKWKLTYHMSNSDVIDIFTHGEIEQNSFMAWLSNCTIQSIEGDYETLESLYNHCKKWHKEIGLSSYPANEAQFGIVMSQQNIRFVQEYRPSIDGKQHKSYRGIKLIK